MNERYYTGYNSTANNRSSNEYTHNYHSNGDDYHNNHYRSENYSNDHCNNNYSSSYSSNYASNFDDNDHHKQCSPINTNEPKMFHFDNEKGATFDVDSEKKKIPCLKLKKLELLQRMQMNQQHTIFMRLRNLKKC